MSRSFTAPDLGLSVDGRVLFVTRAGRMFAYGFLAVVLALYLSALGFDGFRIGILLTLTLVGDTLISLWLTTHADRVGRRRVLIAGAALMLGAGVLFAVSRDFVVLLIAATIGVISPSGNEVGPFLAVEQASLSHTIPGERRTNVFAWYNLAGQVATALGSLAGGLVSASLIRGGTPDVDAYRAVVVAYAVVGAVLAILFTRLTRGVEVEGVPADDGIARRLGLGRSRPIVLRLAALFSLDAFGGGLVPQSLIAYWFHLRWGVDAGVLGAMFFAANILAAISALSAARLSNRIGLINTMVFTHLPSNVLLILVPLMPTLPLAVIVLLARFSISQMDVPTRQSYTIAVVAPDERSAAAGVTGVARTTGAAVSPVIAAPLISEGAGALAFVIAGGVKIVYDLLLYRAFRQLRTPEEEARRAVG
ncbi:MAG TPA: MFS transporter [Candidatus Limnocylindrales bacterium]